MAKALTPEQLRALARLGAEARVQQLRDEIAAIETAFGRSGASRRAASAPASSRPRRRRNLSAEARKRISDAQKRRWAKVRAGK